MIIKFLYLSITKLYNYFFTFFENLFLRNNKINNSINKFKKLEQLNIQKIDFENFEKIITNKYLTKIIFPHKEIFQIAHNLFLDNNLAKKISGLTGFNYTISFFTAYKTFKIDAEEKKTKWYANHFHKDKPYSNNMIKIILSFENINENNGPMEIIIDEKNQDFSENKIFKAILKTDEVLLFYPTKTFHRATSPISNHRFQMMFQLNPSKNWSINENLYRMQKKREPKFPFFSYMLDSKIRLF